MTGLTCPNKETHSDFFMSEEASKPTNFIRDIIDEELAAGKHEIIVTRFPPEPNGYLHIGHSKAILTNYS